MKLLSGDLFRPLTKADIPFYVRWRRAPHIEEWWMGDDEPASDCDRAAIVKNRLGTAIEQYVFLENARPVGFLQAYPLDAASAAIYGIAEFNGTWGIDQFIGEANLIGKGFGTRAIKAFTRALFARGGVLRILTDPEPENARAIR